MGDAASGVTVGGVCTGADVGDAASGVTVGGVCTGADVGDAASGVTVGGVCTGADVGGTASLAPQADRATVAAKTPAMSEQRSIDLSPVMPIVLGRDAWFSQSLSA